MAWLDSAGKADGYEVKMRTMIETHRRIPIRDEVDVLVVGGGTAGVTATIAAARLGARTLVVERYGFLGGLVTGGPTGMHTFFNCYHDEAGSPNVPAPRKKQLIKGLPQEIVDRLTEAGGGLGHIELELAKQFVSALTPADPEVYKWLAMEMVLEAGADVVLHSTVCDVITDGDGVVKGVVLESKSGREAILARVIVDTSGDADVAARGRTCQIHRAGKSVHESADGGGGCGQVRRGDGGEGCRHPVRTRGEDRCGQGIRGASRRQPRPVGG